VSRDVSERIKTEQDLMSAQEELEGQVEERTRELKVKSESLEDTNTALKVLLEMRDHDRTELEAKRPLFSVAAKITGLPQKERLCGGIAFALISSGFSRCASASEGTPWTGRGQPCS
jgi:hypothetical protein